MELLAPTLGCHDFFREANPSEHFKHKLRTTAQDLNLFATSSIEIMAPSTVCT